MSHIPEKSEKFYTKKSLGQHFLKGKHVPELMAKAAEIVPGDTVLEIGPGTGALTRVLLEKGATVIALEADARAIVVLEESFKPEIANKRLIIIHADARTLDLSIVHPQIQHGSYKVVANIPYYLSGHLFRTFLESDIQPKTLVFLVQREVALRIARDKKESLLSLSVKVYGTPQYVKTIGKGSFTPPPKIDSAIIKIDAISKERLDGMNEALFFSVLHTGFASKRKQLIGNLTALCPREKLIHTFSTLGIREDIRAEDLDLAAWLSLIRSLALHTL